ncbi:MAG: ATP-binding cassette domain-containing protein [Lachnospiraceae bacterium]|nr:ATP-binding cassette domain-containing protein [Lachnospiraceae bacterium]
MNFQIKLEHFSKSYKTEHGTLPVWDDLNLTLESGQTYGLMGASGSGKTTLLRILLGLEAADAGSAKVVVPSAGPTSQTSPLSSLHFTAVFQENRLCEPFTPIDNILLVTGPRFSRGEICSELSRLLPEESLSRSVSTLSGGMKRRVAIARALLTSSDAILMDEPFTGLDEDTKDTVIAYIKEKSAGKLLLVTTHQEEDLTLLGAELLRLG